MAKPRPLLERLLKTPDVAQVIPQLHPEVLHRVIQNCGLEECAELVALATPEQIARILEVDVWRAPRPALDEELDADRFAVWLDVLMQSGGAIAAEKLLGLDLNFVVAALAGNVAVFDRAAVSSYTTLDGGEVSPARREQGDYACEIGRYLVEARRSGMWDVIVDLLTFLHVEQPDYFDRVMRGCRQRSDGARELDISHNLLDEGEQEMFDLACERESRREHEGYVTPAQASAFLEMARQLQLTSPDPPSDNPVARAHFRSAQSISAACDADHVEIEHGTSHPTPADEDAIAAVVDVLRDAGVLTQQPRALLGTPKEQTSRLALIDALLQSGAAKEEELAFLANVLLAGCSFQGRAFTPQEARDAAFATCNLGLENWPTHWSDQNVVAIFQVGWTILQRDVCMHAARHLVTVLDELRCTDRDIQFRLSELRFELTKQCGQGRPWRAHGALDVILMLDAPAWASLLALISECPVLHAAIDEPSRTAVAKARSVSPTAFEFISTNSQIAAILEFLRRLPETLTR
jgi:hypothetical protein